jgi:trans-aconitate methyltransferase
VSGGRAPAKPAHLGSVYGAQFDDEALARSYATRPPYPAEVFEILDGLAPAGPRRVLDLGCGTGDVALGLVGRAARIVGVDRSAAMLRVARGRPGGDHPSLAWHCLAAEDFAFDGPYSLVVAGESLHWMDWDRVLPRIAEALAPGAVLAIVEGRVVMDVPWAAALEDLFPRYSTNRDYRPYDLVVELAGRDLFREAGRRRTAAVAFAQSIDDYVESFHTRNGLSRARMGRAAAAEFDAALRGLVEPHCPDGTVRGRVATRVVWGAPRS